MPPLEVSDVVFDAIKTNAVPEPFRKGIHGSLAAMTGSILTGSILDTQGGEMYSWSHKREGICYPRSFHRSI
jgi:hypothetical protein